MKIEKVKKFITNLHNETQYVIHIKKQALNHGLVFKKVQRVVNFNKKTCNLEKLWKILKNKEIFNL